MAERADEAVPAPRRALLVGVQRGLDARFSERPGTCAAVRRIGARLAAGGWQVALLLDDEPADHDRPYRANLFDRLSWLAESAQTGEVLLLLSGPVRKGHFCCRDSRLDRLENTAVPLQDIAAELPAGAGVILDAPADASPFERVGWAIGAGPADAPEGLRGVRGPTPFLDAVVRATGGEDRAELTVDSLAGFVGRAGSRSPWHLGGGGRTLLTGLERGRRTCKACSTPVTDSVATFCPKCGAPLDVEELLDGGRYRLVRRLGQGGMGAVYLAEDTRLKVRRAIKLMALPSGLQRAEADKLRARMVQEARAAQALCAETHHVVQVYDVGFSPERAEPFLVMELLEGQTLTQRLAAGPLSDGEALAIGRQIAGTLALAHARGFVHRDLKPDNIMLVERGGQAGFVKLLDFGLVKAEQAEVTTETGRMMGTLQYMPPEQLRGLKVDARADVFSLGAVLYECLSGQRANPGSTQQEIFAVLLDRGVRSLAEVAPMLPSPLVTLVDRCLSLIPEQRPRDARAVSDALETLDERPLPWPLPEFERGPAVSRPSPPPVVAPPPGAATALPGMRPPTALPAGPGAATALPGSAPASTALPGRASGPAAPLTTPTALPGMSPPTALPGMARPGAEDETASLDETSGFDDTALPVSAPAFGTAETRAPSEALATAPDTRPPAPASVRDLPPSRPPISAVPAPSPSRRRWLLLLPLLAVGGGIAVWLDSPPPTAPDATPTRAVAVDAAPAAQVDAAVDAAPDVQVDAGPQPLQRPAHPLPARPAASRAREGDRLVYRGDSPADAFAALVLDITLAAEPPPEPDVRAGERWQAAPDALRRWLADGVPLDEMLLLGDALTVPVARVAALRAERPEAHRPRGLGTLLTRGDGPPILETVTCSRARAGDRVLTASWKMRGYGKGTCRSAACGRELAHALQRSRQAGERLRVSLTMVRQTEDGDEKSVAATCHIRP